MKRITIVLPALFLVSTCFFYSCNKTDDQINTTSDSRDAMVGNWTQAESSKLFSQSSYTISISKSTSDNENIIIKNFYNLGAGTNTIAKVSGNQISIASQQVSSQTLKGSGSLSNSKIQWNYTTFDGGSHRDTCIAMSSK